jgi:hypothetical protein
MVKEAVTYINLLDYIIKKLPDGTTRDIATECYKSFCHNPQIIKLGVIIHQNIGQLLEPFADKVKVWLLDPYINNYNPNKENNVPTSPAPCKRNISVTKDSQDNEDKLQLPPSKRVCFSHMDRSLQIQAVYKNIESLSKVLSMIDGLPVQSELKDAMSFMAVETVTGKVVAAAAPPAVVISTMVAQYLGYQPAEMNVSDLYKLIGREARSTYIEMYGHAPIKRTLMDQGVEKFINNYSLSDKKWIEVIVRASCKKYKLFPRPTASMSRGEKVITQ